MIIDSHAHYAHVRYDAEFPYLSVQDGNFIVERATRDGLINNMLDHSIIGFIEPSINYDNIEKQLSLLREYPFRIWAAVGVHPTRCINTDWSKRKNLSAYATKGKAIAIGETGLDYHYSRKEQRRFRQKRWFKYQIKLANKLKLPLILHIRSADHDALKILQKHKKSIHGGVVHCFTGDYNLAEKYINLGLSIGIGGMLLSDNAQGKALTETVKRLPLSSILVETDAPFVLPDIDDLECGSNQRKKLCNSSMILKKIIRKIAEIKHEESESVENSIYKNTVDLFNLEIKE